MIRYRNLSGSSGVTRYSSGEDSIDIEFNDAAVYRYTYASAGRRVIEKMRKLAEAGEGLSTYISQTVKEKFETQLK